MKKSIFLVPILLIALYSCKQSSNNGFTITGNIKGLKASYIYFQWDKADSSHLDSSVVTNGQFTFTGRVAHPEMAAIYLKNSESNIQFFLENKNLTITGAADSMDNATVTGSHSQDEYMAFQASVKSKYDKENNLYQQYDSAQKNNNTSLAANLQNQISALDSQINEQTKTFITAHPKSFVSVFLLQGMTFNSPYAELNKLFTGLDTAVQQSKTGKWMIKQLAIMKKTSIGSPALGFTQNNVDGKPVSLSDFKGKYVLLDFWASWCGPCRAENPNVLKAYNEYKNKNFTILSVSLDINSKDWIKAVDHDKLPWTQVSDLKGWRNQVAEEYGVHAIPSNYLIDPNGIIIANNLRGDKLEDKLTEVLK